MKTNFRAFLLNTKNNYKETLYSKVHHLIEEIEEKEFKSDYLFDLSYKIVLFIHEKDLVRIVLLAQEQGEIWAKSTLDAMLKIDWFEGFKEIYWEILSDFHKQTGDAFNFDAFFRIEKETNTYLSSYLKEFFKSHDKWKSNIISNQRYTINDLATPVIPLTEDMAILPIIGTIDTHRAKKIQNETLKTATDLHLSRLVIDLSGVTYIDTFVTKHLFTIINGLKLVGCEAILTGIRSEIASAMVDLNIRPGDLSIMSSLKQALKNSRFETRNRD